MFKVFFMFVFVNCHLFCCPYEDEKFNKTVQEGHFNMKCEKMVCRDYDHLFPKSSFDNISHNYVQYSSLFNRSLIINSFLNARFLQFMI